MILRAQTIDATRLARTAFTTRQGGTGQGLYRSMNLSYAVGDARSTVTRNRSLVAEALGADPRRLVEAQQVHGTAAAVVGPSEAGRTIRGADTLITASPDVWLAVHTADCVPVLILAPGVPAAAAVHAGWRGIAAGAVPAALARLQTVFGCAAPDCMAAIGPAIGPCCYEVDGPVADAMRAAPWWSRAAAPGGPGKWYLDLREGVRAQLTGAGVRPDHIETTPGCTRCQPDLFFSYRRERATGRMAACIRLCGGANRA